MSLWKREILLDFFAKIDLFSLRERQTSSVEETLTDSALYPLSILTKVEIL